MGKGRAGICRYCGQHKPWLSRRGICEDCASQRIRDSIEQMRQRRGAIYQKWLEGIVSGIEKAKEVPKTE